MYTSARVETKTKDELESLKNYERESLDSVIKRLIQNAKEDDITDDEIEQIAVSLKDIKEGNYKTLEEAEKDWGI